MARYKTLKSIAHNVGASFLGTLNWFEGDYALGHTLEQARRVNCSKFRFDLLTGSAEPLSMMNPAVSRIVRVYAESFAEAVPSQDSDLALVSSADLEIEFDHERSAARLNDPEWVQTPYVLTVEIVDDRGKLWSATHKGLGSVEPDYVYALESPVSWIRRLVDRVLRRRITSP